MPAVLDRYSSGIAMGGNGKTLGIGCGGQNQHAEIRGIAPDILNGFFPGSPVDRSHKHIGPGFYKPSFEHSPDGGWGVVTYNDSHIFSWSAKRVWMSLGIRFRIRVCSIICLSRVRTSFSVALGLMLIV